MKTRCPHCNYSQTGHETLDGEIKPREGDISFCVECGEISEFRKGKTIKTNEEKLDTEEKEEFNKIRHAWLKVRARQIVSGGRKP